MPTTDQKFTALEIRDDGEAQAAEDLIDMVRDADIGPDGPVPHLAISTVTPGGWTKDGAARRPNRIVKFLVFTPEDGADLCEFIGTMGDDIAGMLPLKARIEATL